jgi:NAD(P)-dependent dehydrogenase (short-subunit alcohol dehydrogenase family)
MGKVAQICWRPALRSALHFGMGREQVCSADVEQGRRQVSKTIVIVGFGPGISTAVAEKFGAEGFSVALIARNSDRLAEGVAALKVKGLTVEGFAANAADPASVARAIAAVRAELGPITVVHWNAYDGAVAGDLLTTDPAAVGGAFDVAIVGLLAAVQAALPDLKGTGQGAVLVTNGAFGEVNPQIDAYATSLKVMGLALANGAKHKLVGLLSQRLAEDNVYVGEVMVAGAVKGTAFASGGDGIEAATIANTFWSLYQARGEIRTRVS